jgi:hypothetical protein
MTVGQPRKAFASSPRSMIDAPPSEDWHHASLSFRRTARRLASWASEWIVVHGEAWSSHRQSPAVQARRDGPEDAPMTENPLSNSVYRKRRLEIGLL